MKNLFLPPDRARRDTCLRSLGVLVLTLCAGAVPIRAQQALPKTADIDFTVAADGSLNMAFQMTFDAANWRAWKAMVGDEPARMRAQMRHQFAAMTLEEFKLDRDEMNRVAKMSMHSPAGPELRDDGSFQIPVDGYFRLVSHSGREWYFSGNNPSAGGTLNNVKVALPATVTNAYVANPDNPEQALVFALAVPPSSSRWFYLSGGLVTFLGLTLLLVGMLWRRRAPLLLSAAQTQALPMAGRMHGAYPPPFAGQAVSVVPPTVPPRSSPPPMPTPTNEPIAVPPPLKPPVISGEPD